MIVNDFSMPFFIFAHPVLLTNPNKGWLTSIEFSSDITLTLEIYNFCFIVLVHFETLSATSSSGCQHDLPASLKSNTKCTLLIDLSINAVMQSDEADARSFLDL